MPVDSQTTLSDTPKNLICNFRAPNIELYNKWRAFVMWTGDVGLDVCKAVIPLTESLMKGVDTQIFTAQQVINIHQDNQFLYQVQHPHRQPYTLNCVKPEFRRTFSSILFEAYVLSKAHEINREFSFRDFLELEHQAFRRIVLRLRRKGKIVANPERTNPRFYYLVERLNVE